MRIIESVPKTLLLTILLFLSTLLVATPVFAFLAPAINGETPTTETVPVPRDACTDGELQAVQDTNGTLWLIGGCLGGLLVLLAAQVIEPRAPSSALLGQSPDYVAMYSDCYSRAAKKRRTSKALTGCLINIGATVLLYALAYGISAASD